MEWTNEKPQELGYYWYKGPITADHFRRWDKAEEEEKPITIAKVGDRFTPTWNGDKTRVCFLRFTVKRKLKEIPDDALWAGPIKPPGKEMLI